MDETRTPTFPVTLHRGEPQAILLAEALLADVLLIDEQLGRTILKFFSTFSFFEASEYLLQFSERP